MKQTNIKKLRKERKMTLEELAAVIGTSKQTIQRYETGAITNIPQPKVEALAEALGTTPAHLLGWTETEPETAHMEARRIPVLGEIACGSPITALESYGDLISVQDGIEADFCLKAHGDSMIGARIFDGDIVFIRSQSSVENGEIAAVIIGDEATLKRVYFYPEESKLILTPENPRYEPLVYMAEELSAVKILGKAVAFQSLIK